MSDTLYTSPFVILNRNLQLSQTANGVKLHFHNENPGNKKEQLPFYSSHFLLYPFNVISTYADLI